MTRPSQSCMAHRADKDEVEIRIHYGMHRDEGPKAAYLAKPSDDLQRGPKRDDRHCSKHRQLGPARRGQQADDAGRDPNRTIAAEAQERPSSFERSRHVSDLACTGDSILIPVHRRAYDFAWDTMMRSAVNPRVLCA